MTPRLALVDLCVRFGGVDAVQRLSLSVAPGEIHGLIGPNGAGKTTVINAITGAVAASEGRILLDGRDITGRPAHEISRLGVGRTFQHVEPFGDMSVLDNVLVGAGRAHRSHIVAQALGLPRARDRERRLRALAIETLAAFDLLAVADVATQRLPFGLLKRMDLARSMAAAPTLLLMDEPTSGMSESEADSAIAAARTLATERGITLIVVEHNMRVMMALAERITVVQFGAFVAEGTPAEIQRSPLVVNAYLGEEAESAQGDAVDDAAREGRAMLSIDRVSSGYTHVDVVHDVSMQVAERSIVAILGANGAGKTALMRAISGLNPLRGGRVRFDGGDLRDVAAAQIVAMGVIHVPQGRALFGPMSVLENLELGAYLLRDRGERQRRLDTVFGMFPVLKERAWQAAAYLSGGEQQMLAIGRALMSRPKLLLLDEPSLGLAPKVFDDILEKVREIHAAGASILVAEQSARKVLRIADHCYVLENGAVALEGSGRDLARDPRIEQAYLGGAR